MMSLEHVVISANLTIMKARHIGASSLYDQFTRNVSDMNACLEGIAANDYNKVFDLCCTGVVCREVRVCPFARSVHLVPPLILLSVPCLCVSCRCMFGRWKTI